MKKKLTMKETISVASMLFGLFFGAGNLIFPAYMGQQAGKQMWQAIAGFLVTGVGIPLLGVAALGITRSEGLLELSGKVGKRYGTFFTCALYLTIGPFFAIPRCATVPYEVGVAPILSANENAAWGLLVFTLLFFGAVLWFSLRPGRILTWVGKVLNPVFLLILGVLLLAALLNPMGEISRIPPETSYASGAFFRGFLEGYNTMDALAGLAFGIVIVNVVRDLGVREPGAIAANTILSGLLGCLLMAVIYIAVAMVGAQSRGLYPAAANGGLVLSQVAKHYFGKFGAIVLAATVILACLKTAVGLITSCAETFIEIFPRGPAYKVWAAVFCVFSFLVANLGLNAILSWSLPVLLFLYPLAITLILLALFGKRFGHAKIVYQTVTCFTVPAAVADGLRALPAEVREVLHIQELVDMAGRILPFSDIGLGWIVPAVLGLLVGLILQKKNRTTHFL